MTILEIILVATHILMIALGYQTGKADGIQIGRSQVMREIR